MAGDILARWRQSSEVHDVAISPEGENHWWWKQPLERLNALEAQVAILAAERDHYRDALAGLVARFTMNGRCTECGLKGCAQGCETTVPGEDGA